MKRRWRPILATTLAFAIAIYNYTHGVYRPVDIGSMNFPIDEYKGKDSDIPADVRRLDGELVSISGSFSAIYDDGHSADMFRVYAGTAPYKSQFIASELPHNIIAKLKTRQPVQYGEGCVCGRLHVHVVSDEGFVQQIFTLDVDRISVFPSTPAARWPWYMIGGAPLIGLTPFVIRRTIRRKRHLAGHCTRCGYDQRATPLRCPECGLETAVTPTA